MGRTNPTYRDRVRGYEERFGPFRRALRRRYTDDFDRLFEHARDFADAAGYANDPDPDLLFLLSVVLAQEHERRRLAARVEALEGPE